MFEKSIRGFKYRRIGMNRTDEREVGMSLHEFDQGRADPAERRAVNLPSMQRDEDLPDASRLGLFREGDGTNEVRPRRYSRL